MRHLKPYEAGAILTFSSREFQILHAKYLIMKTVGGGSVFKQ